jgi:hypothetical protein
MGEEWMALEGLNHRHNSIMATDPQVIALGNIVGHDNSRSLADSREHGEQNSSFQ